MQSNDLPNDRDQAHAERDERRKRAVAYSDSHQRAWPEAIYESHQEYYCCPRCDGGGTKDCAVCTLCRGVGEVDEDIYNDYVNKRS